MIDGALPATPPSGTSSPPRSPRCARCQPASSAVLPAIAPRAVRSTGCAPRSRWSAAEPRHAPDPRPRRTTQRRRTRCCSAPSPRPLLSRAAPAGDRPGARSRRRTTSATRPTTCGCSRASRPPTSTSAAVEQYLISTIDHGFNASTFTARVIASTGADLGRLPGRRRRCAQRPAARRRAEPGPGPARRDRHAGVLTSPTRSRASTRSCGRSSSGATRSWASAMPSTARTTHARCMLREVARRLGGPQVRVRRARSKPA